MTVKTEHDKYYWVNFQLICFVVKAYYMVHRVYIFVPSYKEKGKTAFCQQFYKGMNLICEGPLFWPNWSISSYHLPTLFWGERFTLLDCGPCSNYEWCATSFLLFCFVLFCFVFQLQLNTFFLNIMECLVLHGFGKDRMT